MNYKGRHSIESVEFFNLDERLFCAKLREIAGGLPAGSFEKIEHLPIDVDECTRTREDNETNQPIAVLQRNHQPDIFERGKPCWQ